jgi:hypothetical protein
MLPLSTNGESPRHRTARRFFPLEDIPEDHVARPSGCDNLNRFSQLPADAVD